MGVGMCVCVCVCARVHLSMSLRGILHSARFCHHAACAGDEPQQALLFSYLWALKEAALKARGTGISAPPGLKGFAIGKQSLLLQ